MPPASCGCIRLKTLVIWLRSTIGSARDCLSRGCGIVPHRSRHFVLRAKTQDEEFYMRHTVCPRVKVGSIPAMDGFDSRSVGYETLIIWHSRRIGRVTTPSRWSLRVRSPPMSPEASIMTSMSNNQRGVLRSGCKHNE